MAATRKWSVFICVLFAAFLLPVANSQDKPKVPLESALRAAIAVQQALPPAERNLFSGALNNWLSMAHALLDKPDTGPDDDAKLNGQAGTRTATNALSGRLNSGLFDRSDGRNDIEAISNPALDFQGSHIAGFTQSTTSTAWCGHNIVTGFDSTVAAVQTGLAPQFNQTDSPFSGVDFAYSRNDGESFTDSGFLNAGPFPNAMIGNPVVACANSQRFYIATSPFNPGTEFTLFSAVGVSISNDGGKDWGNPVAVVTKDFFSHLLDKAWLAVDPRDGNHVYVTYTDFDTEGFSPFLFPNARCPGASRSAIELVSSKDGGRTWSAPATVQEACHGIDPVTTGFTGPSFTGSQVVIGRTGKVYVSYLSFATDANLPAVQLKFRRSDDQGVSFSPEVNVTDVTQTGCCAFVNGITGLFEGLLQGSFQVIDYPSMAVDTRGNQDIVYLVWADGRDNSTTDVLLSTNQYNFGDILLSKSTDGGNSWTTPFPISPTPRGFKGAGRDQFHPGIAINEDGKIAVCYNDRRNDPANNAVDHYCSFSEDGGYSFRDVRQTTASWIPVHGSESELSAAPSYMGDYDGVAAHQGVGNDGLFFNGFQIIKNVVVTAHGRSSGHEQ